MSITFQNIFKQNPDIQYTATLYNSLYPQKLEHLKHQSQSHTAETI